jgi:phosphate transport system permease protein
VEVQAGLQVATGLMALFSFALIFLMLAFLLLYAYPAIRFNGLTFFTSPIWNIGNQYGGTPITRGGFTGPAGASFGGLVFIYGTVLTSTLGMVMAVPLSILVAIALVYRTPSGAKPLVNALVELMAGVPSVVYGLWGVVVLVPWIAHAFEPFGAGSGFGLLASSIILAIMVSPFMIATIRDVVSAQSSAIFEASMALGSTSWQAVTRAVLPSVKNGIVASMLIAFGRALGETMAVLMVCGAAINIFPHNIFAPVNTVAAVIVSQLESALTDATGMAQRSLAELAFVLFLITLGVNVIARAILRASDRGRAR